MEKDEKIPHKKALRQDEAMRTMSYQGTVVTKTWEEIKERLDVMTQNLVEKKVWLGTHGNAQPMKLDDEYYEMLVQFEKIVEKLKSANLREVAAIITTLASPTACAGSHTEVLNEKYTEISGAIPITETNLVSASASQILLANTLEYAERKQLGDVHWRKAYRYVMGFEPLQDARIELDEETIASVRTQMLNECPMGKFLRDTINLVSEKPEAAVMVRSHLVRLMLENANACDDPVLDSLVAQFKLHEEAARKNARELLVGFTEKEQNAWLQQMEILQKYQPLSALLKGSKGERDMQLKAMEQAGITTADMNRWLGNLNLSLNNAIEYHSDQLAEQINRSRKDKIVENGKFMTALKGIRYFEKQCSPNKRQVVIEAKEAFDAELNKAIKVLKEHNDMEMEKEGEDTFISFDPGTHYIPSNAMKGVLAAKYSENLRNRPLPQLVIDTLIAENILENYS